MFAFLGLHFLSFWPFNPLFPFILAFWAFMCFQFGRLILHFWLFGRSCALILAFWAFLFFIFVFWAFISFHFDFFHFLSFWFLGLHVFLSWCPSDTPSDTPRYPPRYPWMSKMDPYLALTHMQDYHYMAMSWHFHAFSSLFLHLCWWPWLSVGRGAPTVCVKESSFTDSSEFTHAWAWKQHWCQDARLGIGMYWGNLNIYYVHTLSFM